MSREKKRVYKFGSFGHNRSREGITLTQIKKRIKAGEPRKNFRMCSLLA